MINEENTKIEMTQIDDSYGILEYPCLSTIHSAPGESGFDMLVNFPPTVKGQLPSSACHV